MTATQVDNNRLPAYDVVVDKNTSSQDLQVMRLDIGVGTAESRVSSANPLPVSATISPSTSSTSSRTQVNDSASDVILLASNSSRKGATVFNDSSALLYLGLGTTTVTSTNYSVKIFSNGYYEIPFSFTGEIRGIWATDPNDGAARVTELT